MNKKMIDVLIVGFALFAMFFGAGNLIFPPKLGLAAGTNFLPSLMGFLITGVGMPLLGIMAVSKAGGSIDNLAGKVGKNFSMILGTVIVLAIGPLFAIPRTAATTFEMGVLPSFPIMSTGMTYSIIFSVIYFTITLFFVLNPSSVIDNIGKVLTPVLLITLAIIIIKGALTPLGASINTGYANAFSKGFLEGYQTMDAIASILFGGIVVSSLVQRGYTSTKDQNSLTIQAGVLAAVGLGLVYGGLMYLGTTVSNVLSPDLTKVQLIVAITQGILGNFGKIALGLCVALACLTTSIGLVAVCGEYFSKLSKGKLSYKAVCWITAIISAIIANVGVEVITIISVPLLILVYPVTIVLIIMNLFDDFIKNKNAYTGAVVGAFAVSMFDAIAFFGVNISAITNVFDRYIPLYSIGFGWIVPAVVIGLIFSLIFKSDKKEIATK